MNCIETKKFYEQDKKEYEIENNTAFLAWLRSAIKDGYYCPIDIVELQNLIDSIVSWYELKYPERTFIEMECPDLRTITVDDISDDLTIEQLLYHYLSDNQIGLINCKYGAREYGERVVKHGLKAKTESLIFMRVAKKDNPVRPVCFKIAADPVTGKVEINEDVESYLNLDGNISLDDLLVILETKFADKLDFEEVKETVYDHSCNVELRHRILELAALKMVYSRNTTPQRGYKRACAFIKEFNHNLGLTLSTSKIDALIKPEFRITLADLLTNPRDDKTGKRISLFRDGKRVITQRFKKGDAK